MSTQRSIEVSEIILGVYPSQDVKGVPNPDAYRLAIPNVTYLLELSGIILDDCLFSGHAMDDISGKEDSDFDEYIPDNASDDAHLFYFGDYESLIGYDSDNPIWYAFKDSDLSNNHPRVDVLSAEKINKVVLSPDLADTLDGTAWLTAEQYDKCLIGRFILKTSNNEV